MLLLYALCCLPLLASALTEEERLLFTSGCSANCPNQSPCGSVSLTAEIESSSTEGDMNVLRLRSNGIPNHAVQTVS